MDTINIKKTNLFLEIVKNRVLVTHILRFIPSVTRALKSNKSLVYKYREANSAGWLLDYAPQLLYYKIDRNERVYFTYNSIRQFCRQCEDVCLFIKCVETNDFASIFIHWSFPVTLAEAIQTRNIEIIRYLHCKRKIPISTGSLIEAAKCGRIDILKLFWESSKSADCWDEVSNRLVNVCASYGHFDCVKELMSKPFNFKPTEDGINLSAYNGHLNIVNYFFEHNQIGFNPDLWVKSIEMLANSNSNIHSITGLSLIKKLVERFNHLSFGQAFTISAAAGSFDIVYYILKERNEIPNISVMTKVIIYNRLELLNSFHRFFESTEEFRQIIPSDAIDNAAERGHFEIVKYLQLESLDFCSNKTLQRAIPQRNNTLEMVKFIVQVGNVNPSDENIEIAIQNGDMQVLQFLIEAYLKDIENHPPIKSDFQRRRLRDQWINASILSGKIEIFTYVVQVLSMFAGNSDDNEFGFRTSKKAELLTLIHLTTAISCGNLAISQYIHQHLKSMDSFEISYIQIIVSCIRNKQVHLLDYFLDFVTIDDIKNKNLSSGQYFMHELEMAVVDGYDDVVTRMLSYLNVNLDTTRVNLLVLTAIRNSRVQILRWIVSNLSNTHKLELSPDLLFNTSNGSIYDIEIVVYLFEEIGDRFIDKPSNYKMNDKKELDRTIQQFIYMGSLNIIYYFFKNYDYQFTKIDLQFACDNPIVPHFIKDNLKDNSISSKFKHFFIK